MTNPSDPPPPRRADPRHEMQLVVRYKYPGQNDFIERYSSNVSRSGIFIATDKAQPVGSELKFEIQSADGASLFKGKGVVRWTREHAPEKKQVGGLGVQFTELDDASREVLRLMMERKLTDVAQVAAPAPAVPAAPPPAPAQAAQAKALTLTAVVPAPVIASSAATPKTGSPWAKRAVVAVFFLFLCGLGWYSKRKYLPDVTLTKNPNARVLVAAKAPRVAPPPAPAVRAPVPPSAPAPHPPAVVATPAPAPPSPPAVAKAAPPPAAEPPPAAAPAPEATPAPKQMPEETKVHPPHHRRSLLAKAESAKPPAEELPMPPPPRTLMGGMLRNKITFHKQVVQLCYERALKNDPNLKGQVTVEVTVAAGGAVKKVDFLENTVRDPGVARCIEDRIRAMTFPGVEEELTLQVPFKLRQADGPSKNGALATEGQ